MASRPTRASEARSAVARPPVAGRGSLLDVDTSGLAPDVEVTFIRETCHGEYDEANVTSAMMRGYTPVTTDDLPGGAGPTLPGRKREDNLIRRGGLILMQRPKAAAEAERADFIAADRSAKASVAREVAGAMDGKNFQALSERPVTAVTERNGKPIEE